MSEFAAEAIGPLLDAVVGNTWANGDSSMDDESLENMKKLDAVAEWLCDRIGPAFEGRYPSQCASAEQVAKATRNVAYPILDFMRIDLQELAAIARQMEGETGPVCGQCLGGYARRIREAIGEVNE